MTNSTDRYWAVDGLSLQTLAWNIQSWGGDRQAPPAFRGSNITVPFRTGTTFVPKVVDQRTMTLGMWVQGCNDDGSVPAGGDQRAAFEQNWERLRAMLWNPYREISISKRVLYPDNLLHTVTAKAQFAGGLNLSMTGTTRGEFTVDLTLADPYFYGDEITGTFGTTSQFAALGNARTTKMTISLPGSKTNPKVTLNNGSNNLPYFQYNGAIGNNEVLSVDVDNAVATYYGNGFTQVRSGLIQNDNAFSWFYLDPGTNVIQSSAGTGTIVYRPAFL